MKQGQEEKQNHQNLNELELKNVEINYGTKTIVKDLNWTFKRGKVNLIVGRAGSGKSSLLLFISEFLWDCKGEVLADGAKFKSEGQFSLAFQSPETLFFNPTVGEEVCFALKMRGMAEDEMIEKGKEWLEKWGLETTNYWNRSTIALSGGEKRRVALAACTVFKPPLIMLDEPLAGLDFRGQEELGNLIEDLSKESCVIVVTHEPEIFLRQDSEILYIRDGSANGFTGAEFYKNAIKDEEFYPLPKWYKKKA